MMSTLSSLVAPEVVISTNSGAASDVISLISLQWRHNERDGVSNHRRPDFLHNRLFRRKSPRHWCLWAGEFIGDRWIPRKRASNAENVSIWWCHHVSARKKYPHQTTTHPTYSSGDECANFLNLILPVRLVLRQFLLIVVLHTSGSTLFRTKTCCMMAPRHYRNQYWLIVY